MTQAAKIQTSLAALVLLLLILLTQWNSLNTPFERDEGEYAYSAWIMRQGMVPYRDAFMQKPPMIIYTYLLAQAISDQSFWPPRVLGLLALLFTCLLVGLAARLEQGRSAALAAMLVFWPMMAVPALSPFAANTEKFMILPLTGVLVLYLVHRRRQKAGLPFAAGIGAVLAVGYKPICLLPLALMALAWFLREWKTRSKRQGWMFLALFAAGGGLAAVSMLSFFIIHGAWKDLWECAVRFNQLYANAWGWSPRYLVSQLKSLLGYWWMISVFIAAFFARRRPRRLFYLGIAALSLLSVYRDPNGNYYLMLVPLLAVLTGISYGDFARWISARSKARAVQKIPLLVLILSLLGLLYPLREQFRLRPGELSQKIYSGNPFIESPVVARRVAELTDPSDRVLIAGSEPQVLYYAKRKSPTRFVIMYPLMIPTPSAERYQNEALGEIQKTQPEVIVYSRTNLSWLLSAGSPAVFLPFINRLIQSEEYERIGGYVREDHAGRWLEPVPEKLIEKCSLVVFKRCAKNPKK